MLFVFPLKDGIKVYKSEHFSRHWKSLGNSLNFRPLYSMCIGEKRTLTIPHELAYGTPH